jgi:putative membrane-bound dehydrogenase-like protein
MHPSARISQSRRFFRWKGIAAVLLLATAMIVASRLAAGEITLATDAPQPLAPHESAKQFQLPPGFHIELVAGEPLVADPVAMDFDARGRIFVCEIHGYNLEGYLDVLELNKTGVLDKAVRRVPATPEATKMAAENQYGTVKLLEDTDGDGRMDRVQVWADHLPPCYGVVAARDGVIVLCAPDILFLADRDGDGKAEVREKLFTGFGLYDLWSRINNPRWGLDNWIYAANGIESGGTIRGPAYPNGLQLAATSFRFKPDGSVLEPTSGSSSGFGLAIDDWGDRFLVANQQHALLVAPLPYRSMIRNPYYAAPNPLVNISSYGHPAAVFPTSQPDPWRLARSKDPAWVKFYGVAEATANGFFTAASGQTVYLGDQFPAEYYGNHFSVDNAQNMIHRCLLTPDGVLYTARRPKGEEAKEFLTSTEQWFRPVNLTTGPDGALYVVDMYRAIIEDYSAIPRYLQQLYIESLMAGADKGRIWRIVADGAPKPRFPDLSKATAGQLAEALAGVTWWRRRTAQRLLVERGEKAAVPLATNLLRDGKTPQARLHALYTLEGLHALDAGVVLQALGDPHFAVRMHALALAEPWLEKEPRLLEKAVTMAGDREPRVALQVALSLGASKDPRAVEALKRLAVQHGADRWMQAAMLSSTADSAVDLLAAILREPAQAGEARSLVPSLASIVGARHRSAELSHVLEAVAAAGGEQAASHQVACLAGLLEGLKRAKSESVELGAGQLALRRLLAHPAPEVAELALAVAGRVKLRKSPEMHAALAAVAKLGLDESRSIEDRLSAIALLGGSPYAELEPLVTKLLDSRQPLEIQLAAIRTVASLDEPQAAGLLLGIWQSSTPKVQAAAMDAVFSRQSRLPSLLDALAAAKIPVASLEPIRRVQLLENPDPQIRQRAQAVLGAQSARKDRQEVMARYIAALVAPRSTRHGKQVFEKQCSKCHQVQGNGFVVGPDLSSSTRRSDEMLVSDVLEPSNQITIGYNQYTVITQDGRIFTGVLAVETATSVTLRKENAVDDVILRKDIDVMAASTNSMMPENLEKEVAPQDVADLVAYLREAFGPVPPPVVTLFDDESAFAEILNEGDGKARIELGDKLSGTASLRVTPPQRWNLRIPGWQHRIAENPGPGEFRYLRFAWKSAGGHGVMIELAADGQWPPAEKPIHRYYAGKNTTGWAALQVSPRAPPEWTIVTCDLWKDFGAFTLTGIAPTAMGGEALFDRIELLRALEAIKPGK